MMTRIIAIVFILALTACSSSDDELAYVERPADEMYDAAQAQMEAGKHEKAAKLFEEVERQHPYSQRAVKAQLMAAYAYYEGLMYDDALVALDRFIQLHPGHKDISYAYYLRALCYYEQITDVSRDQRITELALKSLQEVVRRFPGTEYARDANLKLDLTKNHLAGKEMDVGRYYLRQGQYQAAISRFRTVVREYQTTAQVPEALHRLIECYQALGIDDEARATAAVLGHNYPGSEWYLDTYALLVDGSVRAEDDRSWIRKVWQGVF